MFSWFKEKKSTEQSIERTTIDGFQELRDKYPSITITYKVKEIIPNVGNLKFTKGGTSLLYDAILDFARINGLQFLSFTYVPNTCSFVTFVKNKNN